MKIKQRTLDRMSGWIILEADDNQVTVYYKSLTSESKFSCDYADLDSRIVEAKHGRTKFSNISWFFGFCSFITMLFSDKFFGKGNLWSLYYVGIFLALCLLTVALRLVKCPLVLFYRKNGEFVFPVYMPDGKEFVEYLRAKINKASQDKTTA